MNETYLCAGRRERKFCVPTGTRKSFALDPAHRAQCTRGCARNCKAAPNIFGKAPLARLAQLPVPHRLFRPREPRSSESEETNRSDDTHSLPAPSHHPFVSRPQVQQQAVRKIRFRAARAPESVCKGKTTITINRNKAYERAHSS